MSNWVKFSDRMPTESDCDGFDCLFVMNEQGGWEHRSLAYVEMQTGLFEDSFWLENVPDMPKPRTLEDVVRQYLDVMRQRLDFSKPQPRFDLLNEMKEILGVEENE